MSFVTQGRHGLVLQETHAFSLGLPCISMRKGCDLEKVLFIDKSVLHEFVNLLRSPWIDSQPVVPVQQSFLTYLPARLKRQAESIPWNRFPGSLKVYKYGLWGFGTNRKNTSSCCMKGVTKQAEMN
jgi:hypothetical protein